MNFFSSFLKNPKRNGVGKKALFFVLLFFILSGIILPQFVARAQFDMPNVAGTGLGSAEEAAMRQEANALNDSGPGWLMKQVLSAISWTILGLTGSLRDLSQGLLKWIISYKTFSFTRDNAVVTEGWGQTRGLANMIIILGFIIIGIATALRIREYEAKQLLVKLIVVALLINFSLLICGIFIDGSDIAKDHFLKGAGAFPTTFFEKTQQQIKNLDSAIASGQAMQILEKIGGIAFYNIISAVILLLFAFLFLFRMVALLILVILSPLAFICYVFPFTKKYFQMWWSNFFSWCIIGMAGSFFLYLGDKVATLVGLSGTDVNIMLTLIPGFFLIIGFLVSLQTSAMGAGAAIKAFNWTKGKATGLAKGAGGALANVTGASRAATWTKEKGKAAAEWAGFIPKGSTEAGKRKDLEKIRGSMESGYGDNAEGNTKLAEIAGQRGVTLKQRREKAAAAEILAKRKALNYIPVEKREAVAAHAVAFGVSKETFTKEDASLLTKTNDAEAVQRLREREHIRLVEKEGKTEAEAAKLAKGYSPNQLAIDKEKADIAKEKTKQQKIGYIPPTDADIDKKVRGDYIPPAADVATRKAALNSSRASQGLAPVDDNYVKNLLKREYKPTVAQTKQAREDLTAQRMQEKVFGYESATAEQGKKKLISDEIERLKTAGRSGPQINTDIKTYESTVTEPLINQAMENLNKEKKAKEIKKMSDTKMSELPEEMMDADIAEHSNFGTLSRGFLKFNTAQKDKMRDTLGDLRDRVYTLYGATGVTATDRKADYATKKSAGALPTLSADDAAKVRNLKRKVALIKRNTKV